MNYTESYWSDIDDIIADNAQTLEELRNRTVAITGASGMICSSAVDVLLRYNQTRQAGIRLVLAGRSREKMQTRFAPFTEGEHYRFVRFEATTGDVVDFSADEADFIIYGSSISDPAGIVRHPVEVMLANLVGLNAVLDVAASSNARKLVYLSTSEVYGTGSKTTPYGEDDYGYVDILNPRSSYPSSKRAAETLCVAYGEEFGVDTSIIRPGHLYGPSFDDADSHVSTLFVKAAVAGEPLVLKSSGVQLRSYCHALDCAMAILTVLVAGERGRAYNVSVPESVVSLRGFAEELASAAGVPLMFENVASTPAAPAQPQNPMDNSSLDGSLLCGLGWRPHFSLENGILATLDCLKRKD